MRHTLRADKIRRLKTLCPELGSTAIARKVGCSPQNVLRVLKRFNVNSESDLRDFQQYRAEAYDSIVMRSLESITPKKLEKASAPALMMVAGTAEDKSRLIRGQPTGLDVHVLLDVLAVVRGDRQG